MKEGWKKKWKNTKSEKHKKVFFVKNNEVIKMEDSQKKTQKIENEKKKKKRKNTMKQKKGKFHRNNVQKTDILSNAEEVKKEEIQELNTKEM